MTGASRAQATLDHLRNPSFSSFLDLCRWVAAWIVFTGHLRNPLFYGYGDVPGAWHNPLILGWYFVTGWFGEAVIVFFVLSGFLVGGAGLAKFAGGSFRPADYAVDRFSRLYVAFLPALILTAVLDMIGLHHFTAAGLYDGTQAMFAQKLHPPFADQLVSLRHFVGNLVMLQTFRVDTFGSNPPLWTISAEFWFYVVFGAALVAFAARGLRRWLWIVLLGAILVLLTPLFLYYLGLWVIGIGAALLPTGRLRRPLLFAGLLLGLLVAFRLYADPLEALPFGQTVRDYGVALAFALLLQAMREVRAPWLVRLAPLNKRIADFSFSLYLIHFPLMTFALSALYATGHLPGIATGYAPTDPVGLALYGGLVVTLAGCAWLFAQATEMRTATVRRWLKQRVLKR